MSDFTLILSQLEQERSRLASQLQGLNNALSALGTTPHKNGISAAGRARIAAARRARWAKAKGQKISPANTRKGHTMSAAARARIAGAQRARWARWKREQKRAA